MARMDMSRTSGSFWTASEASIGESAAGFLSASATSFFTECRLPAQAEKSKTDAATAKRDFFIKPSRDLNDLAYFPKIPVRFQLRPYDGASALTAFMGPVI